MVFATELLSVFLILFSVIDIIGSLPVLLDLKKKGYALNAARIALASLIIMMVFLLGGKPLLGLFGVDVQSFAVAGSIILFLIGFEMILNVQIFKEDNPEGKQAGTLVPVVFPLIAGAGTMTTIISLKAKYSSEIIALAILLNLIVVYFVIRSADYIERILGEGGTAVLRKAFGIIILAIAIKLFKENFQFGGGLNG
jgi:multiple antibiotic resistance protein